MVYRFSNKFGVLFFSRIIGGFGSGVIFILVPIYMKELYIGENYNGNIVDLLITQFGFGIFSQYFIGECTQRPTVLLVRTFNWLAVKLTSKSFNNKSRNCEICYQCSVGYGGQTETWTRHMCACNEADNLAYMKSSQNKRFTNANNFFINEEFLVILTRLFRFSITWSVLFVVTVPTSQ